MDSCRRNFRPPRRRPRRADHNRCSGGVALWRKSRTRSRIIGCMGWGLSGINAFFHPSPAGGRGTGGEGGFHFFATRTAHSTNSRTTPFLPISERRFASRMRSAAFIETQVSNATICAPEDPVFRPPVGRPHCITLLRINRKGKDRCAVSSKSPIWPHYENKSRSIDGMKRFA